MLMQWMWKNAQAGPNGVGRELLYHDYPTMFMHTPKGVRSDCEEIVHSNTKLTKRGHLGLGASTARRWNVEANRPNVLRQSVARGTILSAPFAAASARLHVVRGHTHRLALIYLIFVLYTRSHLFSIAVEGVVHPSFQAAAVALGIAGDDNEWLECMRQAVHDSTGYQLRRLFTIVLIFGTPSSPGALFREFIDVRSHI